MKNDIVLDLGDCLIVSMHISSNNFYIEKDILIYDESNLIADLGGYLGLLLGVSVLNIYQMMVKLAKKLGKMYN